MEVNSILGKRTHLSGLNYGLNYKFNSNSWWLFDKCDNLQIASIDKYEFIEQSKDYNNFLGVSSEFNFSDLVSEIIKNRDDSCFYYSGDNFLNTGKFVDCETKIICTSELNLYEQQYYQLWEPDIVMWKLESLEMLSDTLSYYFHTLIKNVDYQDSIIIDNRCCKIWKLKSEESCSYIN